MFNNSNKRNLSIRYVIFMIGVILVAFGIALFVKTNLGLAPVSSVPYVLTFIFPFSLGTITFITNMIMLTGQVILLKGDFPKIQYLQIVMVLIFGMAIDAFTVLLNQIEINSYLFKIAILLIGCAVQATGISLEVMADVLVLPGEGLVKTLSKVFNKEFGKVKTLFDIFMVIISIVISLICLGKIVGLREGSFIAAFTIGMMSKLIKKKLELLFEPLLTDRNSIKM